MVVAKGETHLGRKHRDVHWELTPTVTPHCVRCRRPFESEGAHHCLCLPCSNRAAGTGPYAV